MNSYKVTLKVKCSVSYYQMDSDDRDANPEGVYTFEVTEETEDKAVIKAFDTFHNTIPIANLEHFNINLKKVIKIPQSILFIKSLQET